MSDPAAVLISFDIDGTLETGDPVGPLPLDAVRHAQRLGYLIGSSSDRTITEQHAMWNTAGIEYDFVCRKHEMDTLTAQFACVRYIHIGDTTHDAECATAAGFEFIHTDVAAQTPGTPWSGAGVDPLA